MGLWKRHGLRYKPKDANPPWRQYIAQQLDRALRLKPWQQKLPPEFVLEHTPPKVLLEMAANNVPILLWLCERRLIPKSSMKQVLKVFGKYGHIRGIVCLEEQGAKIHWNELFRIALVDGTQEAAGRLMDYHEYDLAFVRKFLDEIGSDMVV